MRRTRIERIRTTSFRVLQERLVINLDHRRGNRRLGTGGRLGLEPRDPPAISDQEKINTIQTASEPNKKNQNQFQRMIESPGPARTFQYPRTMMRRVGFEPTNYETRICISLLRMFIFLDM